MSFDIASFAMGKAAGGGGGGGGGGNAYAYDTPPSTAIGKDGDYYFELSSTFDGIKTDPYSDATTGTAGWEFTPNENLIAIGAKGYARASYTGTIKLGTSNGAVLAEKNVELIADTWVAVEFDTPVTLTAGSNYIIMLFGQTTTLKYHKNPSTDSRITYVIGRYGNLPGTQEKDTAYSVNIMYRIAQPYPIGTQYYKTGGVWVPV